MIGGNDNPCTRRLVESRALKVKPFPSTHSPLCLVASVETDYGNYEGIVSTLAPWSKQERR